jgi:hypothetical protein
MRLIVLRARAYKGAEMPGPILPRLLKEEPGSGFQLLGGFEQ